MQFDHDAVQSPLKGAKASLCKLAANSEPEERQIRVTLDILQVVNESLPQYVAAIADISLVRRRNGCLAAGLSHC